MKKNLAKKLNLCILVLVAILLIFTVKQISSNNLIIKEVFFYSDGLKITGTFCENKLNKPSEAIIFVRSPRCEKNLLLYNQICKKLAEKGYLVLSISLRGYGNSEAPPRTKVMGDLDFKKDIHNAISSLQNNRHIKRIHLMSHSFASSFAVTEGIQDNRVTTLIALSPNFKDDTYVHYLLSGNITEEGKINEVKRFIQYAQFTTPVPFDLIQILLHFR